MPFRVKRIYEPRDDADGARLLVDGLWPRGLARATAGIHEWLRELTPSAELRRWFGHREELWPEFQERYFAELRARVELAATLDRLRDWSRRGPVTLLYAARDVEHNNAVALQMFLTDPTHPGPLRPKGAEGRER